MGKKSCRYLVQVKMSTVFCSVSLTVPSSALFLVVKVSSIHPKMTPLSPDCLAASHRSVVTGAIGPTRDGSSSHEVILEGWLTAWPKPLYFGPWWPDAASCNLPYPFPQRDPKGRQVPVDLVCRWGEASCGHMHPASGLVGLAVLEQGWQLFK